MPSRVLRTFKDTLFPNKCLACGLFFHPKTDRGQNELFLSENRHDPVEQVFQRVMGPFLCPDCLTSFSPIDSPCCTHCGKVFKSRALDHHACGDCVKNKPRCAHARSLGMYDGSLMALIHALKYNHKIQLARPLGRLLFFTFMHYDEISSADMVVPIPLHGSRLKQRGFNQAFLLVREWPSLVHHLDSPQPAGNRRSSFLIDYNVLTRNRKTISQTGLGREQRTRNVKDAFQVTDPSQVRGKRILLVDDVYTTGATAEECARTLLASGAAIVNVLTLARTE